MKTDSAWRDASGRLQPVHLFCLAIVVLACCCLAAPGAAQAMEDDRGQPVWVSQTEGNELPASLLEEHLAPDALPVIDVWHGLQQRFGHLGKPQAWVNILGNASATGGLASMSYRLNGGPAKNLAIGPDGRRLHSAGDFNVDIATTALTSGANQVQITATAKSGEKTVATVMVDYVSGETWAEAYSIDWESVGNIQDVAQVVDGLWAVEGDAVRTVIPGYDRLIAIGDVTWKDYEVLVPITVHSYLSPIYSGIGVLLRWAGHTDYPVSGWQPKTGWLPLGAIGWYIWSTSGPGDRLQILGNDRIVANDASGKKLSVGIPYWFKMRVETTPGRTPRYSLRVWPVGQVEPSVWDLTGLEGPEDPQAGSLCLIAQQVDASFGEIKITPLNATVSLSLAIEPQGTENRVLKDPDKTVFFYWDVVKLTPEPEDGWKFEGWGGKNAGDPQANGDGTWSLVMDEDKGLVGRFAPNLYTVTLTIEGDGEVQNQPGNPYLQNQYALLTPVPGANHRFVGWSGPDAGSIVDNQNGTYSLLMNGHKVLTARFELEQRTLVLSATAGGVIEPSAGSYSYPHGEVVTLTATPDLGWSFVEWLGGSAGDLVKNEDGSWRLVMNSDKDLMACFSRNEYSVTVTIEGKGTATLFRPNPYYHGEEARLKAFPATSWKFAGWGGENGSEMRLKDDLWLLTVDGNKEVTAIFITYSVLLPLMPVER